MCGGEGVAAGAPGLLHLAILLRAASGLNYDRLAVSSTQLPRDALLAAVRRTATNFLQRSSASFGAVAIFAGCATSAIVSHAFAGEGRAALHHPGSAILISIPAPENTGSCNSSSRSESTCLAGLGSLRVVERPKARA